jgi:hypothetical protein
MNMLSDYNSIPLVAEPKEMLDEPFISNDTTLEEKGIHLNLKKSHSLPHNLTISPETLISDDEEDSSDDDVHEETEETSEFEPHPTSVDRAHFGVTVDSSHKVC